MSVWTTDGEVRVSCDDEFPTLNWCVFAMSVSELMRRPVVPCPPDESLPHILGPGVSHNESPNSILWAWSPLEISNLSNDKSIWPRTISTIGTHSNEMVVAAGARAPIRGPSSLLVTHLWEDLEGDPLGGVGVVLSEHVSSKWTWKLEDMGYNVIESFWDDRSRGPLEAIRERVMQISECSYIVSDCPASIGIAHSLEIPCLPLSAPRPIFDRNEESLTRLDVVDAFEHCFGPHNVSVDISVMVKTPVKDIDFDKFQEPLPLEPQQAAEIELGLGVQQFLDHLYYESRKG